MARSISSAIERPSPCASARSAAKSSAGSRSCTRRAGPSRRRFTGSMIGLPTRRRRHIDEHYTLTNQQNILTIPARCGCGRLRARRDECGEGGRAEGGQAGRGSEVGPFRFCSALGYGGRPAARGGRLMATTAAAPYHERLGRAAKPSRRGMMAAPAPIPARRRRHHLAVSPGPPRAAYAGTAARPSPLRR